MPTNILNKITPEYLSYIIIFSLTKWGYINVFACIRNTANADEAKVLTIRLYPTCNFKNTRNNATDPITTKGLLYAMGYHQHTLPVKNRNDNIELINT